MNLHPKVVASTTGSAIGGALATVVVWLLSLLHVIVPADVATALTVVFGALAALLAGYATPNPQTAATPQNGAVIK